MENNDLVTKSELRQLQLIAKLEDTVEILTGKLKVSETEKEDIHIKYEELKLELVKLTSFKDGLIETNSDLEKKIEGLQAELKIETEKQKSIIINNHAVQEADKNNSEKITQLETELTEAKKIVPAPTVEEQIKKGLNSDGRISERVLKFILKLEELPQSFRVGSLSIKRVFLNKEFYELIS